MQSIEVTHLASSVSRLAGGLLDCVRLLAKALAEDASVRQRVLGLEDGQTAVDLPTWAPVAVAAFPILGPASFGYSPKLASELAEGRSDLVHLHGLWKFPSVAVSRWFRQTRAPYVVSPQGMLEPWALQRSRAKKQLAMFFFQRACLRNAACIHATAPMEVESIRRAGFTNPVVLLPNGVEMPPPSAVRGPMSVVNGPPATRRTVLFLSRIHPKKGLLNLVRAWAEIQKSEIGNRKSNNWRLVIVGPDECGHLAEVRCAVREAGLDGSVEFPGEAWGDARWKFYHDADLFVLPTFSENFGLVIAEALACGVPVITSKAAPWAELETHQCGWWIDVGVEPLVTALRAAMSKPPAELHALGMRGRILVMRRYDWRPIGRQMVEVYRWLQGGPKPHCVV